MKRKAASFTTSAMMVLLFGQIILAQDRAEGKNLYVTYCSGCHGESGKGDGPAAGSLPVKPVNHTDGNTMNKLSDKFLIDIISKGGSGVQKSAMMPAWGGQLKEKQIRDIVTFIRSIAVPPYKPSKDKGQ